MESSRRSIGNQGEAIALQYLQNKGYDIVATNYTIVGGEIDIIAKDRDFFVFIEVKYRTHEFQDHPLDTFTLQKRKALKRSIQHYLMIKKIPEESIRVDFIGIMPLKNKPEGHRIWHARGVEV